MPRETDAEAPRIAAAVRAYLARATTDTSLGLSYEAIASGAKVSRGHFKRTDHPLFIALSAEIEDARAARRPTPAPPGAAATASAVTAERPVQRTGSGATDVALSDLLEETLNARSMAEQELAARIKRHSGEVGRVMQVWLGHHRRTAAVEDAPLLLHDLDRALGSLRHHAEALRPLVAELQRRERHTAPAAAGEERPDVPQAVLDL